jgi:hypothetical protein
MIFRPLLCLTGLDRQRTPDVCNRLKVEEVVEDKILSKELVRSPETN